MSRADLLAIQRDYPQVFFACHVEHVRATNSPDGISSREAMILTHLDARVPVSPARLAKHMGVVPSTISAALKRLESLGYVRAQASASDRRSVEIRLAPRGERAMESSSVLDASRLRRVLARLTPAERADARRGLGLLARAARALIAREAPRRRDRPPTRP